MPAGYEHGDDGGDKHADVIAHRPDEPGSGAAFTDERLHVGHSADEVRQVHGKCGPRLRIQASSGPGGHRQDEAGRYDSGHTRQQRSRTPLPCLEHGYGHQWRKRRDPHEKPPVEDQRCHTRDGGERPVDQDWRPVAFAEARADPDAAGEKREIAEPPGQQQGNRSPRRRQDDAGDSGDGDHEPGAVLVGHPTG